MSATGERPEDVVPTLHLDGPPRRDQHSRVLPSRVSQTLAGPPTPPRRKVGEQVPTTGAGGHDMNEDGELPSGTELLGRYRLEETVGRGGMASVYRGRHIDIGNSVAIKVMSSEVAKMKGAVARFLTEARAVAAVQHPGVVRVTDFGELDCGRPFMVMEHLAGRDLDTLVCDRGPLAWDDLKPILIQVCNALGAAHEAGIVHRDVKPANIFVLVDAPEGQDVKVLDFGIAKVTDEMVRADDDPLTQTNGCLVGTPDYMAPEQGREGEVDQRADIYALGVTAFTCLTGQPPFSEGSHPIAQIAKHIYETPPTLEEAGATVCPAFSHFISPKR
jgi:eukaryotic-like serine/threonine-protein kinase